MAHSATGRWSKTPKHLLREAAVRELTRDWNPGRFAEFGVGTGAMTLLFVERGFTGEVYDIGEQTRKDLRAGTFPPGGPVTVVEDPEEIADGSADYLFAFEVLEHVENDLGLLSSWTRVLKPDGHVLITVPAHMRKFSNTDRRVGHVRRYERQQLQALLEDSGFADIRIANYGFPLGNLSRVVMRNLEGEVDGHASDADQFERSVLSGVEQPRAVNVLSRVVNERTVAPFAAVQRRYFDLERGDGYVATARLPR